jgi:nucleotide-binding universal stress UspA family protein
MYSRILVPIDGSEAAAAGLQEAIRLGKSLAAKLCLVHVVNELIVASPFAAGTFDPQQFATSVVEQLREDASALLHRAESQARSEGVETECRLLEALGTPAGEEIVRHAHDWPADLIVMGTHGRRGIRRIVMGSDAELVVRTSPVPVLLVHGQELRAAGEKVVGRERHASKVPNRVGSD